MGKHYILDANTVIDYVGDRLPESAALAMDNFINDDLITSIVVKIEVLGFDGDPGEMKKLNDFLALATIFYVDDAIADKTIDLRKTYKKLKLGDALIAATALVHGFTLLTRNTKDFQSIAGLACVNPHDL
ncbi:type II toxin-antitoxin system VapC family toxin [Spirosoma sp. KCTC 42546]|uniref:type II toxin-antitoxin system VapC family toxin n=1 Tax=Spirosoma sp. KCTC 42546 TaxID=2520506 RepID=UPI00115A239E|nr:type II toxin-antitoxin system VapC family toxin [Spirosoma sp. KCTC 42546]QDK79699.1 type II toxin-antitoxin system VapC family toxin [Spirosoma sp. KCTC 42546]